MAGASWEQPADVSGFSSAAVACRAVSRYFGTLPAYDRKDSRALWRQRMEVLWRQSLKDVKGERPGAVRAAAAVAQHAAQLDGLEAPTVTALIAPSAEEFDRVVRALSGESDTLEESDIFAQEIDEEHRD